MHSRIIQQFLTDSMIIALILSYPKHEHIVTGHHTKQRKHILEKVNNLKGA